MKTSNVISGKPASGSFFLDTNVFMYAVGAASPLKNACLKILDEGASGDHDISTSTEVIQEVIHRYSLTGRRSFGIDLSNEIMQAFDPLLPIEHSDLKVAMALMMRYPSVRSRDAIHAAVALNHGITQIISTDRDFDIIEEVERVLPISFAQGIPKPKRG